MQTELDRYLTWRERDVVTLDVSAVGSALLKVKAADLGLPDESAIIGEVAARILNTLPTTGYAVSIVVPLHNEEGILPSLMRDLIAEFGALPFSTEVLLCENGSTDRTREMAHTFAGQYEHVTAVVLEDASYGAALKSGILAAKGDIVVIFNADLWCSRFFVDAVLLLQGGYDIVIASKQLIPSLDRRTLVRRAITRTFNWFLRRIFRFVGTDTHGMKAVRRSRILEVLGRCRTSREVFDTELVLRSQRSGLKLCEVPTEVRDTRPARLSLLRRVPSTFKDLVTIWRTL